MKISDAIEFLNWLQTNQIADQVRVVVPLIDGMKIGDTLPLVKKQGYAAAIQTSAFCDREISVVDKVEIKHM
jgi:hypothetical protein